MPTPTPIPTTTPLPQDDPTQDWTTYTVDDLNLSFKLPPQLSQFGELSQSSSLSETGSESCWTFPATKSMAWFQVYAGGGPCSPNRFGLAATTIDHSAGRSSGFADAKKFETPDNIPSSKIYSFTNPQGVKIIRISGGEHPKEANSEWEGPMDYFGDLGPGKVGAFIQYSTPNYEVITATMDLTQELTPEVFDRILSTFRFSSNSNLPKQLGFIKSIIENQGQYSLTIDYIDMISDYNEPNGFRINNTNPKLRTFVISPNVAVFMQTYSHTPDGNFAVNQPIPFQTLVSIFSPSSKTPHLKDAPYWISLQNDRVISITEQYLP